jgi:hypothetical protein
MIPSGAYDGNEIRPEHTQRLVVGSPMDPVKAQGNDKESCELGLLPFAFRRTAICEKTIGAANDHNFGRRDGLARRVRSRARDCACIGFRNMDRVSSISKCDLRLCIRIRFVRGNED